MAVNRFSPDVVAILAAILKGLLESLPMEDGEERIAVVLDPADFTQPELDPILGRAKWMKRIGDADG